MAFGISDNNLAEISQMIPQPSIITMNLNIVNLEFVQFSQGWMS